MLSLRTGKDDPEGNLKRRQLKGFIVRRKSFGWQRRGDDTSQKNDLMIGCALLNIVSANSGRSRNWQCRSWMDEV